MRYKKGTGKSLFMQIEKLSLTIHVNFHFPKPASFRLLGFSSLLPDGILLEFHHQTVSITLSVSLSSLNPFFV